jgi:transglutaminase-like putative cysteine protease
MYAITNDFGALTVLPNPDDEGEGGGGGGGTLSGSDLNSNNLEELATLFFLYTSDYTGTTLLKANHFGDYIKSGWDVAAEGEDEYAKYLTTYALTQQGATIYNATVERIEPGCQFLLPYYSTLSGLDTSAPKYDVSHVTYDYLSSGKLPSHDYENSAIELEYSNFVYQHYTKLALDTKNALLGIVDREMAKEGLDRSSLSVYEIIKWVDNYVKHAATYNLEFEPYPEGVDTAVYFLEVAKEGVCRHYATSAASMLRALGIPARYTVGFKVSTIAGQTKEVLGDRAHAWVEVYIDGLGWVTIDPTGSSGSDMGGDGGGDVGEGEGEGDGEGGSGGEDMLTGILGSIDTGNLNDKGQSLEGGKTPVFKLTSSRSGKILFKYSHTAD